MIGCAPCDFVADRDLSIPREAGSDAALWGRLRRAAAAVGAGSVFPAATAPAVLDDHTPFLRAGIPAVDLIDWSYAYKDTVKDTYDKLSANSVDAVGETITELIRTWPDS